MHISLGLPMHVFSTALKLTEQAAQLPTATLAIAMQAEIGMLPHTNVSQHQLPIPNFLLRLGLDWEYQQP